MPEPRTTDQPWGHGVSSTETEFQCVARDRAGDVRILHTATSDPDAWAWWDGRIDMDAGPVRRRVAYEETGHDCGVVRVQRTVTIDPVRTLPPSGGGAS